MVFLLFIYPPINTDSFYHIDKLIHLDFVAGMDTYKIWHDFFLLMTSIAVEQTVPLLSYSLGPLLSIKSYLALFNTLSLSCLFTML